MWVYVRKFIFNIDFIFLKIFLILILVLILFLLILDVYGDICKYIVINIEVFKLWLFVFMYFIDFNVLFWG